MKTTNHTFTFSFCIFALTLLIVNPALAGVAAPWDSGFTSLLALFSGKTSLGLFFCMAVAALWKLMEGSELGDWTRRMLMAILGISAIIAVNALYTIFFGAAGAII